MSLDIPAESEVDADADADADDAVDELAAKLGDAIAELPEYRRFLDAKERVESSEAAQAKIREFERVREEFALARQTGEATQQDVRELKAARAELDEIPEMADFLAARSDLERRLRTVDERISDPLAIAFGETASVCCQDQD